MEVTVDNLNGYTWDERVKIRETYSEISDSDLGKTDPYIINLKFSPIEFSMWYSLRIRYNTRYFRPEIPIGKYFVDFADPIHKIVIECDGKEYHKNTEKDNIRQLDIENEGWFVIRFNAKQILSNIYGKLVDLLEREEIDDEEYRRLIQKNKDECIDCYFSSYEFKRLLNDRNPDGQYIPF